MLEVRLSDEQLRELAGLIAKEMQVTQVHPASDTEYFTVAEAASRLKVSREHVYKLLAKGEIQRVKVGRAVRISGRALEAYSARDEAVEGWR